MNTPTLGYEADTEISKSEIARRQLNEAIALFLQQNFLCAITLAGAAETIFSGLLNSQGTKSSVERSVENIVKIREVTGLALMKSSGNKLFTKWNTTRNALKHHDKHEDEMVTANFFDEAYWMIRRALADAKKLGVPISNEVDFENWCILELHL